jgi:hypothetical protein
MEYMMDVNMGERCMNERCDGENDGEKEGGLKEEYRFWKKLMDF